MQNLNFFGKNNFIIILQLFITLFKTDAAVKDFDFLAIKFVCVTEQRYVSIFFTCLWSVRKAMLFRYMGKLVTSVTFLCLRFIFACRLVFVFINMSN